MTICSKCGVFVNNIYRHEERNRCEAVENRRLYRSEIKKSGVSAILGKRGSRTAKRNGELDDKGTKRH